MYICVNTLKCSEESIVKNIESEGATIEKVPQLNFTFKILWNKVPLIRMPSYQKALFSIQDKASCLATEIADPKAGYTVLDVCAAPRAKTTYMALLMQNKGAIYSIDYSKRRMNIWKREKKRIGVEIAMPIVADAHNPLPIRLKADLVVLDLPCTSTGTFSKPPSVKWILTERSVSKMAKI
jgi:16S rRNA C967 or C1407 C5-methylase (RsmB/RsmF family)